MAAAVLQLGRRRLAQHVAEANRLALAQIDDAAASDMKGAGTRQRNVDVVLERDVRPENIENVDLGCR
ncbi:MAG TPA: hypothetical protein VH277_06140 [Gemmatimonadaceae bacterium]|nr:hypothetical protein [Gemmatimonadaceae bacterium]